MPVPRVRVVTDSTADLPPDVAEALDITVIPAYVQFGPESFRDGLDLSRDEFFRRLVQGPVLPTTAAPAVGVFVDAYRLAAERGAAAGLGFEGILAIHVSSRLSGLYNAARLGAEAAGVPVRLVDSQQVSIGTGILAVLAARAARAGMGLDDIEAMATAQAERVYLFAMLETLDYVQRSGRLGKAQWLVGTVLNIKPIIRVRLGEVLPPRDILRTRARAMDRLVELAEELAPFDGLAVVHARAPEQARGLMERLQPVAPDGGIVFGEVGVTIGTYAGPGAVGFIGVQAAAN
jgi:DegV family protein with EDD domain